MKNLHANFLGGVFVNNEHTCQITFSKLPVLLVNTPIYYASWLPPRKETHARYSSDILQCERVF